MKALESSLSALDHLRSALLSTTLRIAPLRRAFCSRPLRLSLMFVGVLAINLNLALAFPLWVLALGPAIWGVPHIFSSIRYFHFIASGDTSHHDGTKQRLMYAVLGCALLGICAFRLFISFNFLGIESVPLSEWRGATFLEPVAMLGILVVAALLYRRGTGNLVLGILLLLPIFFAFWMEPLFTIGALVLVHNFVGFGFWIRASDTREDRAAAWFSLILMTLAHILIFAGAFDPGLSFLAPAIELPFAGLSNESLGRMIAPWSENPTLWAHATIAYAFGQAMHYFVWMKAIPDQVHYHPIPTSFRQSIRLLETDFGKAGLSLILGLTLLSAGSWMFLSFPFARMIYFGLAAFHGYIEFAGLALSKAVLSDRASAPLRVRMAPLTQSKTTVRL